MTLPFRNGPGKIATFHRTSPWIVSGITSLILFELDTASYLILLVSVATGVVTTIVQEQRVNA